MLQIDKQSIITNQFVLQRGKRHFMGDLAPNFIPFAATGRMPVYRPGSSKTLALYKSFTYLLTYLLIMPILHLFLILSLLVCGKGSKHV